ncbi:MAG: hypothetical protein WAK69_15700 [Rhodoplanes sp.]
MKLPACGLSSRNGHKALLFAALLMQECQGLALRDGRDRRAAAGIDLFSADHARRLGGSVDPRSPSAPSLGCASRAIALSGVVLAAGDFASANNTVSAASSVSKAK